MKRYLLLLVLLFVNRTIAQNFQDTKGELQISNSGTATYTLPIAIPPSIKSVAPTINLTYSSGVRGGIAGQGWSINSISAISRIATRRDIDGFVDGVDFDDNDKLALDGQRLLLKTGTYWATGSTYETEYKSNTKIELLIEGTTTYFVVTAPDGSRSWYGSKGSGSLQNSVSVNSWYIVRYEDTYGNGIDYNYSTVVYNNTNQLYIDTIAFSGNATIGIASQDKIKFNYEAAKRVERDYLKGVPVYASQTLKNIEVFANNDLFRTYTIEKATDTFGYERVSKVTEKNAQGEESNPVFFTYETTPAAATRIEKEYTNNLNFTEVRVAGDFDGDGLLDFAANNQIFTKLFNGNSGNIPINLSHNVTTLAFSATLIKNFKMNQYQSIVEPFPNIDALNFTAFELEGNNVVSRVLKNTPLNNSIYVDLVSSGFEDGDIPPEVAPTDIRSNEYLQGDFNGDGISEVLVLSKDQRYIWSAYSSPSTGQTLYYYWKLVTNENSTIEARLVDLSPYSSTQDGSRGNVILSDGAHYICKEGKKFIVDMNGDGKSDILVIDPYKNYSILEITQLDTAPWYKIVRIGRGTLDEYSTTKQMLFGDYNGDGKTDIMLPTSEGGSGQTEWNIYYSNPNPAGGEFFVKESQNIVEYWPNTGGHYELRTQFSNYYAIDINGDGKSDVVRVFREYYKPNWIINDHNTKWQVTAFTNNIGKTSGSGFFNTYDSGLFDSPSPDIPIPITSNYRYQGANTDLVIVRGHHNKIEYYQFNKNVETENRLQSVSEANGNIVQTIEYSPMVAQEDPLVNPLGDPANDFYSSSNTATYPNIEIIRNYGSFLVSKLTAKINNVSKYQNFKYYGYVSNYDYGTVGFKRTSRSSWYLDSSSDPKIWTTQYNDIDLRGANTITWTSTDAASVFNGTPTNLLSTKTNIFATYTEGGNVSAGNKKDIIITDEVSENKNYAASNSITASSVVWDDYIVNYQAPVVILKPGFHVIPGATFRAFPLSESAAPISNTSVYNVLLTKQTIEDHLSGIKTEISYVYDGTVDSPSYYGLETQRITKHYSGSTLQGSSTLDTQYDSNPAGVGSAYYIGRPKKVNSSNYNVASGDTRTSEESYTYTGTNLTKTEKKGHNTYAIIEDMTYDTVGNLLTKTVSAPSAPIAIATRTITDEYDSTKRFVVKKTDHQGFITTFAYNSLGQVTNSTDYLGGINDYSYDNWGKLINTTVTNAAAVPLTTTIAYTKLSTGGYKMTTTNNLDAKTVVEYDVLGRAIVNSTKGFTVNTMVSKQIVYDALGRKQKESEPYFSSPNLWTVYEYDYLMRPTKVTAPTGKIQIVAYSGLTTVSIDDGKTTTATVDALGNKVQSTDPGGTINFKYYANGALKESDYQGNKVTIVIDGWGNKVSMSDPSAGNYTYSYDAFGQLKTETTPNGTTAFVYDTAGIPTEKTIIGTNTNSKTTYAYNALNQITSSTFVDNLEGKTTTNAYEYDSLKRLFKTIETTPYATFIKELTYDTLGRVNTEKSTASAGGKTSIKTIKNTYQNGFPWQILDNDTQQVLWQSNTVNERGQLLTASLGNGIAITNSYDQYGYVTQMKHDKTSPTVTNIMTLNTVFEVKRGNLDSRTNSLFNRNETYKYDSLDRLTEYTNGLGIQEIQVYDDQGRITQNSVGTYAYNSTKTYQNKSVTLTPEALTYYTGKPLLNVTYNTFKSPYQIEETGIDKISFTYNDDNDRSTMFYGGLQTDKLLRTYRKHYSADGSMEIKQNTLTGAIEFVTYIGGDGYSAPVVLKSDGTTQNYLYLHRDYQGTIVALTNQAGAVVEKRLFDAWGNVVKVQDGAGNILAGLTVLDRGYTGHEHLQSVGLIHMNGRLYDSKLHRFLQPDNYVQQPENTQNYNKYGYCLNNPLKYTDPSGELFGLDDLVAAVIIGAVIAATTYTMTAALTDVPFSVGGLAKATFIGAASAAVTFGIGSACSTIGNFYIRATVQALSHGTFQGSMTAISGGKFWSGFAAGALSSIAASAWSGGSTIQHSDKFNADMVWNHAGLGAGTGNIGMIAFGTVAGGAGAALTGGNFWQGAVTGLVVSGLNHGFHKGVKINDKGGDTTDYDYDDNGNIIGSTSVHHRAASQWNFSHDTWEGYGWRSSPNDRMATGAITDDSLNFTSNVLAVGEIYKGARLIYMGLSSVSKASLGIKVVGDASKGVLRSSLYYKAIYGSKQFIWGGQSKLLPTLFGPSTTYLSSFYGRNAVLFGAGRIGIGATVLAN